MAEHEEEKYYERWTLAQRVQHIVLIVSFMTLVVTGLPVRYLTVFHLGYIMLSRRGQSELLALIPGKQDLLDMFGMLRFYVGLEKHKPRFDRYNFIEKFEYLALAWGTVVMVATGFILWFEEQAMLILPKWALDVATVVHSWEAVLAFLAIVVWHLYHVHLNPEVFPMSRIWLDGKISETELKEHHPLEYERIKAAERSELAREAGMPEQLIRAPMGEEK